MSVPPFCLTRSDIGNLSFARNATWRQKMNGYHRTHDSRNTGAYAECYLWKGTDLNLH